MSLLKKLLNKDAREEGEERRSSPQRVCGDVLGHIKFQVELNEADNHKLVGFFLKNISINGFAFIPDEFDEKFEVGSEYKAFIDCAGKRLPLQFLIVHKQNGLAGCRVISNNIDYGVLIRHYFKIELAALKSTVITTAKLNKDPDGTPHWITSTDNCELFYVLNEQQGIAKYHIGVFGNIIHRDRNKKITYKQVWSGESTHTAYKGSELLKDVNPEFPVRELLENGLVYLKMLECLKDEKVRELITLELEFAIQKL